LTDAARLRTFADQAAAAIQNAQLHEQVQRHAAQLEQRVAERTAELERERSRLQGILDAVDEALYFVDVGGNIQYANAATNRITGYSFDEMIGHRPHDLWRTSATRKAIHVELDRVFIEGTSVYGVEVVNRHKSGALYHAQLSVAALRDADGRVIGFAVAQRDVTQLKELEHLKSQFTNRIGHELRTPLTSLMIYLDLLENGKPEKRAKYLHTLNHEADRLRRLIEGFLRMSEVDAASDASDLVPLSLNEIVSGMLLKQRASVASRRIEIEPQLDPALPLVWAEAGALTEVVERILDNAVNYTPADGHIAVTTLMRTDGPQRWVVVSIVDSGPGFSPTDQLHLFERFYRGDAARDYKTPGAGLSLAICHELIKRLGGRLIVENDAAQGAAVSLWLTPAA
jgi:PAS domain S-box-containing protein